MDCARVDEELVGFQLAALDGATRAAVETHLTGCARCVSSFLALKRALDAGEDAATPSQMARARIRKEAERQLAPSRKIVTARWAIAATAAAAMIAAPLVYVATRAPSASVATPAATVPTDDNGGGGSKDTVDTARTTPENLAFL
ncbi:MAG: zf-HC2 domain-containing protein [Myxococcales bacterium]|nr:zf-HC2 domain-containing protein [Myxococcales bacterium]